MRPGPVTWLLGLWLAAGVAVFLHGAITGSGLAGFWLYHDLVTSHKISPDFVNEALFVGLCVPPLAALAWRGRGASRPRAGAPPPAATLRRLAKILLGAGIACGAIAAALWLAAGDRPPAYPPPGSVPSTALGARPADMLDYEVINYGKTHTYRHRHSLWTVSAGEEIGAVIDVREMDRFPGPVFAASSLPAYLVWALRAKGFAVRDDVPVYVPAGKTTPLRVYIMIAGGALTVGLAILALVLALAARIARRRSSP